MRDILTLILCAIVGDTLCAILEPLSHTSIEDNISSMKQKMDKMEERLLSLERKVEEDLAQKVKNEFSVMDQDVVETFLEERSKHAGNVEKTRTGSRYGRNERSVTLDELHQKTMEHKEDVEMRLSNLEITLEEKSARFDGELREVRTKCFDAFLKIRSLGDEASRTLKRDRLNIESLEAKEYLTRLLITSHLDSRRDIDEVIRKNITSSAETLRLHIRESLLGFQNIQSNFTTVTRDLQNSMSEIEKDTANITFVSKLHQDLKNIEKTTKAELQSIKEDIYPRVKNLEERCQKFDEFEIIDDMLNNHTSEIETLNRRLLEFQNCNTEDLKDYDGLYFPKNTMIEHLKSLEISCKEGYSISSISPILFCNNGSWNVSDNICIEGTCDGQPPTLRNGKPKYFERQMGSHVQYECDRNFAMFGNSTVHCNSGKWEGHPPVCSLLETTFYLEASGDYGAYIRCYSDDNSKEIEFSRLPDAATDGKLPPYITKRSDSKSKGISFNNYQYIYGVYKCGFKNGAQSAELVLPLQSYAGLAEFSISHALYFVDPFKVANVGDTVVLQLHSTPTSSVKWKHNGVIIPSWDGKTKIEISNVKTSDAGIYESYLANQPRSNTSVGIAFLKLTVRKCKANLYGEHCDQKCPDCYNGGICHDILGMCLCPDGFIGNNCEKACPEGYQGADCSVPCRSQNCVYGVHCKPDPYGCFCSRGYNGAWCGNGCKPGAYGADCRESCHCRNGPSSCNRFTGACSGGCSVGWTGDSCQIQVLN